MIDRTKLLTRENSARPDHSTNSGLVSQSRWSDRTKLLTREITALPHPTTAPTADS